MYKQKNFEKNFFCWHLVSHLPKKQDPDPVPEFSDLDPRIQIHIKMSRIHNNA
jgi:hypothetical protein